MTVCERAQQHCLAWLGAHTNKQTNLKPFAFKLAQCGFFQNLLSATNLIEYTDDDDDERAEFSIVSSSSGLKQKWEESFWRCRKTSILSEILLVSFSGLGPVAQPSKRCKAPSKLRLKRFEIQGWKRERVAVVVASTAVAASAVLSIECKQIFEANSTSLHSGILFPSQLCPELNFYSSPSLMCVNSARSLKVCVCCRYHWW